MSPELSARAHPSGAQFHVKKTPQKTHNCDLTLRHVSFMWNFRMPFFPKAPPLAEIQSRIRRQDFYHVPEHEWIGGAACQNVPDVLLEWVMSQSTQRGAYRAILRSHPRTQQWRRRRTHGTAAGGSETYFNIRCGFVAFSQFCMTTKKRLNGVKWVLQQRKQEAFVSAGDADQRGTQGQIRHDPETANWRR